MIHKKQLLRDGIRCQSLHDNLHHSVYTIDTGHEARQAVAGKHICHDFTDVGVLEKMDRCWYGLTFQYIVLDYFYCPNTWHQQHFSETMYTTVLPVLAA